MLGTLTVGLIMDAFGSISDNAGGIAEMSQIAEWVGERIDVVSKSCQEVAVVAKST